MTIDGTLQLTAKGLWLVGGISPTIGRWEDQLDTNRSASHIGCKHKDEATSFRGLRAHKREQWKQNGTYEARTQKTRTYNQARTESNKTASSKIQPGLAIP